MSGRRTMDATPLLCSSRCSQDLGSIPPFQPALMHQDATARGQKLTRAQQPHRLRTEAQGESSWSDRVVMSYVGNLRIEVATVNQHPELVDYLWHLNEKILVAANTRRIESVGYEYMQCIFVRTHNEDIIHRINVDHWHQCRALLTCVCKSTKASVAPTS